MIWLGKSFQFQQIQVPQDVEGKDNPVPEATIILMKFESRQKYSDSQWCFRFIVRFKGNPVSRTALKLLVSGTNPVLRGNCLLQSSDTLNIRFKIPVQEEFISCKNLKVAEEDLLPWCAVQTWVSCLMGSSSYDHLGASCSNIGVFTKETIALLPSWSVL